MSGSSGGVTILLIVPLNKIISFLELSIIIKRGEGYV